MPLPPVPLRAAALLLAFLPAQALAANCLDRVREMAAAHGATADPPAAAPGGTGRPVSPGDLARSGGVVEPPATTDRSVITPPRDPSGMPTLPDVRPSPGARPRIDDKGLDAADRSTLQALLVAARAQGERGREAECLEGLRKAEQLLQERGR